MAIPGKKAIRKAESGDPSRVRRVIRRALNTGENTPPTTAARSKRIVTYAVRHPKSKTAQVVRAAERAFDKRQGKRS